MKNLKANNERRADGVYFVRSASDQTARDEHLLYLLVSDGKILRTAMQFSPTFDAESVRERFFQIVGKIDSEEILTIDDMDDDVDISELNLPEFFANRQIPVEIIFRYFFSEIHHSREDLQDLCFAIVREYQMYCDENYATPIAEIELAKRYDCALNAFWMVWEWKEFAEQNRLRDKDIILAAAMIASLSWFFKNDFPSANAERAEDVLFHEINYQMQNYNVDKSIARRVKKIMHRIFENDDAFRQGLINNEFNF